MNYWIKEDKRVALMFQHTIRKHDDYAFFNNTHTKNFMFKSGPVIGYLPKYFELKWTTQDPQSSDYLDTCIHIINNPYENATNYIQKLEQLNYTQLRQKAKSLKLTQHGNKEIILKRINQFYNPVNNFHNKKTIWNIKTYNKKDGFKVNFAINSFPHFESNIPIHSKLGAVTGQLHSFLTTNYIDRKNFMDNTIKLFQSLISRNKYPEKSLNAIFKRFIYKQGGIYHTRLHKIFRQYYTKMNHHNSST